MPHDSSGTVSAPPAAGRAGHGAGRAGLAAAGGVLGAIASISCCILPLVFFGLGVSGAWIANLTALEPYQPAFFAMTAGLVGIGYYLSRRQPDADCAHGACARPLPSAIVRIALSTATFLVLAAIVFRYLAPWWLGV